MQTTVLPLSDREALDQARQHLRDGCCVALPTETVYGLAADATNGRAVARIYEAKGRPSFNPLIVHVDSLERARSLVRLPKVAIQLAERFWPGPLTLVAPRQSGATISDLATAGLDTLAVRWPRSEAKTGLVAQLDRP